MTPADAELLHAAGLLQLVSSAGDTREYRIAPGAECLFRTVHKTQPTAKNRPAWAYDPEQWEIAD